MWNFMEKQEMITKVLEGKSVYRDGSLSFSCPKLELYLSPGVCEKSSFVVMGRKGIPLIGTAITDNMRLKCANSTIKGNPCEVEVYFDTTGLDEGECIRGEIKVISNQGEYGLPYMVHVIPKMIDTSMGQVKNLFHFTNLAKTNWDEAVKLFYHPDFEKTISGNDRQYRNVYRALCSLPEKEQNVEEFLLHIRKKQKVEFFADKENLILSYVEGITKETVLLTRSGWGYSKLKVETEGGFLSAEKSVLSDDDFLGNRCQLDILVDAGRMHAGLNLGRIRISNEYSSLEIPVSVENNSAMFGRFKASRKGSVLEFMQLYLLYKTGKISKQAWLKKAEILVDGITVRSGVNLTKELLQVQLLVTRERYNEASWLLSKLDEHVDERKTNPEVLAYYYYLSTLIRDDEEYVKAVTNKIRYIHRNHPTKWIIAWFLLYLDAEYNTSISRKWVFLEEQFEQGCHSPVWYMEAAELARKNPTFLMKNTPFVIQVLNFMVKYDYLTDECVGQIHYLAGRIKDFSPQMYKVLQFCYEKRKDMESLRAICSLLIKGGKVGAEYVKWYKEGIERELWLTRLYEYYILSIDMEKEEEIPDAALRYFSYRSELPYERTAYVYAYVIRNSEKYKELYRNYLPEMEKFLMLRLERGQMNRNIGCIFRRLIQEEIISEEIIDKYADRLLLQELKLERKDIRRVIVMYGKLEKEIVCSVNEGIAYVPVYDEDYSFVFEGRNGSRIVNEVKYEQRIITYPQEMLSEIFPLNVGIANRDEGVMLFQCEHGKTYTSINEENAQYAKCLWESKGITNAYRNELGTKLLQYYMEQDKVEEADVFLEKAQPCFMSEQERAEAVRCMISRGMYEMAYDWISEYGMEKVSSKHLVRLCSRLLQDEYRTNTECMTFLAYQAFRMGKYDENVLEYLSRNYCGLLKDLKDIWLACENFEADSYDLCERLLMQMLFSGEFVAEETQIFERYLEASGIEELKNGYLEHFAFNYFINGYKLEESIWKELIRRAKNNEIKSAIGKLALLEYFSKKEVHSEEECEIIKAYLNELVLKEGFMFAFFRKFLKIVPHLSNYENKTFLEYRTESDCPMILHYMLVDGEEGKAYRTEEMNCCYPGIYTKNFTLFFGESIHYYITEKREGKEKLVTDGILHKSDVGSEIAGKRYCMVNDIIMALSFQNTEKAEQKLEKYYHTDFMTENLFSLQ